MMVADVEVGVFLSGGVDSSLVALLMQRNTAKKLRPLMLAFMKMSMMNQIFQGWTRK